MRLLLTIAFTLSINAAVALTPTTNGANMSLADAVRLQVSGCWHRPTEPPNPTDLVAELDVTLHQDGTVDKIRPLGFPHYIGNPFARAATEAAMRAIRECQPYKLPPERYEEWKEINPMRFDPGEMAPPPTSGHWLR